MKKILLFILAFPVCVWGQSNYNLSLVGSYNWDGASYDSEGSDIWGWIDPSSGVEYALVGLNLGFSVIDLSTPQSPTETFFISDVNSTWRDIKTWGHYAYITTEGGGGLLIVDLSDLTGQTYTHYTGSFDAAHNLFIDENGVAYIFGSDIGVGGALFLDVATNPMNPTYLGQWDDYYIHDGMVRGDTMWAGCIYEGEFYAVDVSDKTNPQTLGHHVTPNQFTHNAWVSDDGNYVFTTDELSDSYIGAYDISDMSNIQEVDRIQSNPGSNSIPHNTHVDGNFLVTSWYRDGTIVHDATDPNNLIQVAYYDSYSGSGDGFDGCWGTYPFLPSGLIISTDINSASSGNGKLLIYERGFLNACFLEGNVTSSSNGSFISGASIEILNTTLPNMSNTNLLGNYSSGTADANTYDVVCSALGYISDTASISLNSGSVIIQDFSLECNGVSVSGTLSSNSGAVISNGFMRFISNDASFEINLDNNGNYNLDCIPLGEYDITVGSWGFITMCTTQVINSSSIINLTLDDGYYDDFTFDFGWVISGGIALSDPGRWERGDPEGTSDQGLNYNPENDINADCFEYAYVTGLDGGGQVGSNDVDDSNTILTSPIFDLSQPLPSNQSYYLTYYSWFSNGGGGWGGGSLPNDSLRISITNGNTTVDLETMTESAPDMGQWNFRAFELSQYLSLTGYMQIIVEAADWDALGGHWVEGGFDKFEITSSTSTNISDLATQDNRKAVQIVDILGREVTPSQNIILFYIYDDGTVEKKIIVE